MSAPKLSTGTMTNEATQQAIAAHGDRLFAEPNYSVKLHH